MRGCVSSTTKTMAAMPGQVSCVRPQMTVGWGEERSLVEGGEVAGQVELLAEVGRGLELVLFIDRQEPFIKCPVTEMAEGQPVMHVIVVADGPGDDVGGGYGRMPVSRQHANAAKGTAMFVGSDNGPAEALVAHRRVYIGFAHDFLLFAGLFQEGFTVLEGGDVDGRLS